MARERTGSLILSGVIGTILSPLAVLLLFVLIITIPFGIALLLLLLIVTVLCVPFTAASLGKAIFRKWHRVGAAALFGFIFGVLVLVPVAGFILFVASFMYMLGYLIQLMFLGMRGLTSRQEPSNPPAGQVLPQSVPVVPPAPQFNNAYPQPAQPDYAQPYPGQQAYAPNSGFAPQPQNQQYSFAHPQPAVSFVNPPAENTGSFGQASQQAAPQQNESGVSPVLQAALDLASYEQNPDAAASPIGAHAAPAGTILDEPVLQEPEVSAPAEETLPGFTEPAGEQSAFDLAEPEQPTEAPAGSAEQKEEFSFNADDLPELPRID